MNYQEGLLAAAQSGVLAQLYRDEAAAELQQEQQNWTLTKLAIAGVGVGTVVGVEGITALSGAGAAGSVESAGFFGGLDADASVDGFFGTCFRAGTEVLCSTGLRAIETVQIGSRVLANVSGDTGPAIDPADYRLLRLSMVKDGQEFHLAFLRPAKRFENVGPGDTIQLSVLELELRGRARVLGVEACPPIEDGPGRVVTGAIQSQSIEVWRLKLVGLAAPIETTGNHPIFSEDRHDFIKANNLHEGERLRTRTGVAVVESLERNLGSWDVFNLEIDGVHQYYVTEQNVLVHNNNGWAESDLVSQPNGDVQFRGMTVQVQEDLTHLPNAYLEDMLENGTSPITENCEVITLHHVKQNPAGPLWEIPGPLNDVNNLELHPSGNAKGAGLTLQQRAAFNAWRNSYWQARAAQELARRALLH